MGNVRFEADTLIGAVVELANMLGKPIPHIQAVYACVKLLDLKNRDITIAHGDEKSVQGDQMIV